MNPGQGASSTFIIEPSINVSISYSFFAGTNISEPFCSIVIPICLKTSGILPRFRRSTFFIVRDDFVMAANPIKLPTSIISASIVCSVPPSCFTPEMISKLDPIPEIFAPIRLSIWHSCTR